MVSAVQYILLVSDYTQKGSKVAKIHAKLG